MLQPYRNNLNDSVHPISTLQADMQSDSGADWCWCSDAPLKLLKDRQSANYSPSMRLLQYDSDIIEKRQKMCSMARKKLNEVIIPWQLGIFNKQSHILHSQCHLAPSCTMTIYARIFTGQWLSCCESLISLCCYKTLILLCASKNSVWMCYLSTDWLVINDCF